MGSLQRVCIQIAGIYKVNKTNTETHSNGSV